MKKNLLAVVAILYSTITFATTFTVVNSGLNFSPATITINQGDTVVFSLANPHNAQEVDQSTWNANGNSPVTGFNTPVGGGTVTGLSVGTHYYVCSPHASSGMKGQIIVNPAVVIPNVWINEIHYDNTGTDTIEGYEIAGPAGTNLACYRVFLYTGTNGNVYSTDTLAGIIPNQACGYGTVWFAKPANGMQNGPNDGIVLEYAPTALQCGVTNQDTILQFLSYEGTITASSGRANGLTSTDIGVAESATTGIDSSLQLTGAGTSYAQFTWATAALSTRNLQNHNQLFCGNPSVGFVITSSTYSEGVGTFNLALTITNPNANPTSVDVNVLGGGTATSGTDFSYAPLTVTFPGGSVVTQNITVTVTDDQIAEGTESFTFQLAFPTNNATIGANGQHVVTITDNDTLKVSMANASLTQYENIGVVNIPVQLAHLSPNATSVTVHLVPAGTTATQGSDFFFNDTTITWAANAPGIILVPVTVVDDALVEPDETVRFQLTNPTNGAVLLNDTFLLVIQNNDTQQVQPASIRFVSAGSSVTEFTGIVPVILEVNNPTTTPVTFIAARNDAASTATVVLDYTYQNLQFTNGIGISYDTVYFHVIDDLLIEPTETAVLHVVPVSSNALPVVDSVYTLSIINNDTLTFSFNGAGYSYVEDTNMVQVKVTISSPVADTTYAVVSLTTGNATIGQDFTFTTDTLVFLPNSIDTQGVWVHIIDDTIVEPNEQINFNLSTLTNGAHIGISAYTLTIIDNDTPNGIDETVINALKVYPNPVASTLFIQTENELANVDVVDLLGNVVMQLGKLPTGKNVIDVSALSAGMYFINVRYEQNVFSKRFVKQN